MKIDAEHSVIPAFFLLLLLMGIGTLWDHTLSHDYPYGYSSADAYQHQVRAEWIKQQGNYAYEAPHIVVGFDDVIGYYMPGAFHLAVIFSHLSGLESYDALYAIVFLSAILSALVVYYALRSYNPHVALLSLPVMALMFSKNFYMGILLGQWPYMAGTLFLAACFWILTRLGLKKSWILVALFVSAVALTHTSELVFVVGFLGVALLLALRKKEFGAAKTLIIGGVIAAAISAYYVIIFVFTWGTQFGYHFYVEHVNPGFPNVRIFQDFSLWIIGIMMAGMLGIYFRNTIIALLGSGIFILLAKAFNLQNAITNDALAVAIYAAFIGAFLLTLWIRKPSLAELFSPYMLIIGYASFIGFGPRAFQTRFMWPVTLAPLFGLGAYKLIMLLKGTAKIKWSYPGTLLVALALTGIVVATTYEPLSTQGTMYPERWEMFTWLQENAQKEDRALFFYGDGYTQTSMLYNAKAAYAFIDIPDYIGTLNNQTVKRDYTYGIHGDYGPGYPYRKGLLDFGYHLHEENFSKWSGDVCLFDYYIFDKVTGNQNLVPLIQYNMYLKEVFVAHGMSIAFENAAAIVVKNNNPRGECIA